MNILDLPQELIDEILVHSITSRGFPRALRLKLVCSESRSSYYTSPAEAPAESFYASFSRVLFATKTLDDESASEAFHELHTRRYYGADTLWHDYLVFRCRNEVDPSVCRFVEIRDVATALASHFREKGERQDLDLDGIIDDLCWLALEGGERHPALRPGWDSGLSSEVANPGLNLLSAATYFGCIALVRDLLSYGHDPTGCNDLFPSPMYIAAWKGQAAMLKLLQEHLPEFEDPEPPRWFLDFRSKIGPGSLHGAATRGDMEMVRLALYPPSRILALSYTVDDEGEDRNSEEALYMSSLIAGEKPGFIPTCSRLNFYIARGMTLASDPEVYDYLQSLVDEIHGNRETKSSHMASNAAAGDIVMVRHLLDNGADADGKGVHGDTPLMLAARGWHEDIVDLLLDRGAKINDRSTACVGTVLTAAAKAGSVGMMHRLLGAGARVDSERDTETLEYAVKLEHTSMVELLLYMGAGTDEGRKRVLRMAEDEGLDSMVGILNSWGI